MKCIDLIKQVRHDMEELKNLHESWLKDHSTGLRCYNYEEFLQNKYYRSDADIVREGLSKGAYLQDAEEFLANEEKKEKAN